MTTAREKCDQCGRENGTEEESLDYCREDQTPYCFASVLFDGDKDERCTEIAKYNGDKTIEVACLLMRGLLGMARRHVKLEGSNGDQDDLIDAADLFLKENDRKS
jgi:hypothetical protein